MRSKSVNAFSTSELEVGWCPSTLFGISSLPICSLTCVEAKSAGGMLSSLRLEVWHEVHLDVLGLGLMDLQLPSSL